MGELEQENANLRLKLRVLEMAQVRGSRREEDQRQIPLQIQHTESIRLEEEAPQDGAGEVPVLPSSTTRRKGKLRVRGTPKFEHIPVSRETILIPLEVRQDPKLWEEIGEEETFELLVEPTRFSRHRIVRKKFRHVLEREQAPIIAKAPVRFCSSYASVSLAVYIALSKYLEHGALYRLEKKFARLGADIPRQSQSDIIERMALWVRPLYELIDQRARESTYLQIDETFIKYINGKAPGSGQGYFWAINAPALAMVFKWIPNRRHENVETLLEGFSGILQSDGYKAYAKYAAAHAHTILYTACWSHSFRKFRDALKDEPREAKAAMTLISELYKLEEQWDAQGIDAPARKHQRAKASMPIAQALKAKLDAWGADLTISNNKFREAVNYTAGQWDGLLECLRHGHTKLDTNLLESKFRPTKIGEKNWMFIGHPNAGHKSAILYTLLTCCRTHGIEPRAYLTSILEALIPADSKPGAELLESLLPWNWVLANPSHLLKEQPTA